MKKLFGTDGVRGVANIELTAELSFKIGKYLANYFKDNDNKNIFIGMDTRRSCHMIYSSLAASITSMGLNVYNLGVIPTPAVAYLTKKHKACFGIVISASHNPYQYNGIKVFNSEGYKLSDDIEIEIENSIFNEVHIQKNAEVGEIFDAFYMKKEYVDYILSKAYNNKKRLKVCLDCANGATFELAKDIFSKLNVEALFIGDKPDGLNINKNYGSTHMENLISAVEREKCDLGFAFDGDGDRLLVVDEEAEIMDGDHILAALAYSYKKNGKLKNDKIVGTVMSNIGLDKYLSSIGVNVVKVNVGDRYVLEEMLNKNYIIGGEQSGHIIFKEDSTTGDGLLTAVKILNIIKENDIKVSELNNLMKTYPQVLKNAKVKRENKNKYMDCHTVREKIDEINLIFKDSGRVLIRPSGTEPLVRVMIEGSDSEYMEKLAQSLVEIIEKELG